jgi:hypothetical protein
MKSDSIKSTQTRSKSAIAILAICLGCVAQAAPNSSSSSDSNSTSIPNLPSSEELRKIYGVMSEVSGLPPENFVKNPTENDLKSMYLYARDARMLLDVLSILNTREAETMLSERSLRPVVQSKSADCNLKALSCAGTSAGMILACSAATAADGFIPTFDYKCAAGLLAAGGTCGQLINSCVQSPTVHNPPSFPRNATGTITGTKTTGTCGQTGNPHENRAHGVSVKYSSNVGPGGTYTLVTGIRLTCANGQTKDFLSGGPGGSWSGSTCSNGKMVQGLSLRYGSYIDAAARVCDYVPDSTTTDTTGALVGGSGGAAKTITCNEGEYLYGLNTWTDTNAPANRRIIEGVELICRGM